MKTFKIPAVIGALLILANSQSMARPAPPDIILNPGLPDLTGSFMDVTYNYDPGTGTGDFVASGWTSDYSIADGNGGVTDVGVSVLDSYILSATINYNAGNPTLTGGTLTINGAVNGDGNETAVTLLTANLVTGAAGTAFGYGDGDNNLFQFLFAVTGGSLGNDFGGNGAAGGIIFSAWFDAGSCDNPFTGSWAGNFDNNGSQVGDIDCFPVPEPTTANCFLLGLGALACCRHFSKNRRSR